MLARYAFFFLSFSRASRDFGEKNALKKVKSFHKFLLEKKRLKLIALHKFFARRRRAKNFGFYDIFPGKKLTKS